MGGSLAGFSDERVVEGLYGEIVFPPGHRATRLLGHKATRLLGGEAPRQRVRQMGPTGLRPWERASREWVRPLRPGRGRPRAGRPRALCQKWSTSTTAWANAVGASCGRLCPTASVRCSYFPVNMLRYPVPSPGAVNGSYWASMVMVGTAMVGA